jgi:hypothetical protein
MNTLEIDSIPGFASIIDFDCKYLAINQKLADLFGLDKKSVNEITIGGKCHAHEQTIKSLVDSPVGTEINWEYNYGNICLLVFSKRCENFIINQAIDISDRKQLEQKLSVLTQRQSSLLKAIPKAIESGRSSTDELKMLVKLLTTRPIIEQDSVESMLKLEVETQSNTTKIQFIENLLVWNNDSFLNRIKKLEIQQDSDSSNWEEIQSNRRSIERLSELADTIVNVPGGARTIFFVLIILNIATTFIIDIGIRKFGTDYLFPVQVEERR